MTGTRLFFLLLLSATFGVGLRTVAGAAEDPVPADLSHAQERLAALSKLAEAGHATAAEVLAARREVRVLQAINAADRRWRRVARPSDDLRTSVVSLSRLVHLPASGDEEVADMSSLPAEFAASLSDVLLREAAAVPSDIVAIDIESAARRVAAIRKLASRGTATAAELSRAEDDHHELISRRVRLNAEAERLSALADQIAPSAPPAATTATAAAADATRAIDHLVPPDGPNRAAAVRCFAGLLEAEVALVAATEDAFAASDRLGRIRATAASARRPGELAAAERDADRAARLRDALRRHAVAAAAAVRLAARVSPRVAAFEWSRIEAAAPETVLTGVVPPPVDGTPGYASLLSHRPYREASPLDLQTLRQEPRSDPTRGDRSLPPHVTTRRSPPLSPPRWFEPGATYSSGYAFGQKRWDLPRTLRYPRADSYGGPWYLPGSPTNRLRYQTPQFPGSRR